MRPFTRRIAGLAVATVLALTACGDDDDGGGAPTAAEGSTDVAAYCDAALAIELLPEPDVDFETATPEEIGAAYQQFIAEDLRPLIDEVKTVLPDEIREPATELFAVFDEIEETGDPSAYEDPAVADANIAIHDFDLESCGWEQVDVTAVDYGFDGSLPTDAGVVSFELTNDGEEAHVAVLARKKASVDESAEDAFAAAESEEQFAESFDVIGEAFAPPGGKEYGVADLTPGEYVLFCPIPVGTTGEAEGDGPPHFTQGMVETFNVN